MTASLVTGGCGFIGSHLVDALLARGDRVVVLDSLTWAAHVNADRVAGRLGPRLVHGDVRSSADLDRAVALLGAEPDVVYHLAAESHVDRSLLQPAEALDTNARGTMVVAHWCAARGYPLVYCSTDEVYGDLLHTPWDEDGAVEETTPLRPSSPYSAGKAAGELAVFAACRSYGLRAAITRGCNAWGERQVPEKVVPIACRLLATGRPVPLHGGGAQIRQWIHVSDFVEGLRRAAEDVIAVWKGLPPFPAVIVYNLAGPDRPSVRDLVLALADVAGVPRDRAVWDVADRPGQDRSYHLCGRKAAERWGYRPRRSILDPAELRALLDHYGTGRADLAPWCAREGAP